jgi:hypothetical protein
METEFITHLQSVVGQTWAFEAGGCGCSIQFPPHAYPNLLWFETTIISSPQKTKRHLKPWSFPLSSGKQPAHLVKSNIHRNNSYNDVLSYIVLAYLFCLCSITWKKKSEVHTFMILMSFIVLIRYRQTHKEKFIE